jgi:sigma-54 specific flagellar transcriptional regulator A
MNSPAYSNSYAKPSNQRPMIYGFDSPMGEVESMLLRIAKSDATCLITGETGSGKEVAARELHNHSDRANKPFVAVNCAAIPESLLESELFGHVRGAFTGAATARQGRVSLADGGTLFLDEIGELPLAMQAKLLRLIQERVYEPVGGTKAVSANFRLIAATNRELAQEVSAGRFRQDLYFRLLVCPVHLPALRERPNDILILFNHFWQQKGETRKISDEAVELMMSYSWPGNVREMENLTERLSVCALGERLEVTDLPSNIRGLEFSIVSASEDPELALELGGEPPPPRDLHRTLHVLPPPPTVRFPPVCDPIFVSAPELDVSPAPRSSAAPLLPVDLQTMLRELEDSYIAQALSASKGNKALAAKMLGMQRTTLAEKLRRRRKSALECAEIETASL